MHLIIACILSLAVAFGLRERRTPEAGRMGAWMGGQGVGQGVLVVASLIALSAGDSTLLAKVGGFMGFDAPSSLLLAAGILGGVMGMIYLWRRGSMIPALLQGRHLAGAPVGWAMGMKLP